MKKKVLVSALASAALLITATMVPSAHAAGKTLVIWADKSKSAVISKAAADWAKSNGVTLQVVPTEDARNKFVTQAPKGGGPDIIVGAHDWVGQLAASGLIGLPGNVGASSFAKSSIQGFTYKGIVYGVPYAIENIALFTNTKLVKTAPKTFADLEATWLSLKASNPALTMGIDDPAGAKGDTYYGYPFFSALGGYIFKTNGSGSVDPKKVGVANAAFLAKAPVIEKWFAEGLLSKSSNYDFTAFLAGKAPFAITGPWMLDGIKKAGISYTISAVPPIDGVAAQPFVGAQGFMLSNYASNKLVARQFLNTIAKDANFQYALYKDGNRYPALLAAQALVKDDADTLGFGDYGATGVPMPNIPQMSSVWGAVGDAWSAIANGKATAVAAFKTAQANIVKAINS